MLITHSQYTIYINTGILWEVFIITISKIGVTDEPLHSLHIDQFKVGAHITGLCDFIRECETPLTIALQGDWGTGKTSFINMMRENLNPLEYYHTFLLEHDEAYSLAFNTKITQLEIELEKEMKPKKNEKMEVNNQEFSIYNRKYFDNRKQLILNHIETYFTVLSILNDEQKKEIKTSIEEAQQDNGFETIIFNTWRFSQFAGDEDLSISFLSYLISKLTEDLFYTPNDHKPEGKLGKLATIFKKNKDDFPEILISAILNRLVGSEIVEGGKLKISALENINEFRTLFDKYENTDRATAIEELKALLNTEIQHKIKRTNANRLVIFIDDLDRLIPSVALNLLEVIKLFLDVKNCVFVLAIDYQVVTEGIKSKFGEQLSKQKGQSFFDKMIQLPFSIPTEFYQYRELIMQHSKNTLSAEYMDSITRTILLTIGNNPRAVKRLLNSYNLILKVRDDKEHDEKRNTYLMIAICIQLSFPHLYSVLCDKTTNFNKLFSLSSLEDENETQIEEKPYPLEEELQKIFKQHNYTNLEKVEIENTQNFIFNLKHIIAKIEGIDDNDLHQSHLDDFLAAINNARITSNDPTMHQGTEKYYKLHDFEEIIDLLDTNTITAIKVDDTFIEGTTVTRLLIRTIEYINKQYTAVQPVLNDVAKMITENDFLESSRFFMAMYADLLEKTANLDPTLSQKLKADYKKYFGDQPSYTIVKGKMKFSQDGRYYLNLINLGDTHLIINTKLDIPKFLKIFYIIIQHIDTQLQLSGEKCFLHLVEFGLEKKK